LKNSRDIRKNKIKKNRSQRKKLRNKKWNKNHLLKKKMLSCKRKFNKKSRMKKWKKLNKLSHKVLRELLLKLRVQPLVDLKRRHQRKRPFLEDSQQIREKGLLLLESNLAANLLQRENQLLLKRLDNHCLLLKRRNFKT